MDENEKTPQTQVSEAENSSQSSNRALIIAIVVSLILLAGIILGSIFLSAETVAKIKHVAIIICTFTSVLLLASFFILIYQLASLSNLLRTEVKPILKTTRETVNNVKGTVSFMGDNLVSPVINVGAKVAGVRKLGSLFFRKK